MKEEEVINFKSTLDLGMLPWEPGASVIKQQNCNEGKHSTKESREEMQNRPKRDGKVPPEVVH